MLKTTFKVGPSLVACRCNHGPGLRPCRRDGPPLMQPNLGNGPTGPAVAGTAQRRAMPNREDKGRASSRAAVEDKGRAAPLLMLMTGECVHLECNTYLTLLKTDFASCNKHLLLEFMGWGGFSCCAGSLPCIAVLKARLEC